jgi:hypothetical protein
MKKNIIISLFSFVASSLFFNSCGPKAKKAADLTIDFKVVANGKPVSINNGSTYTNASGQEYTVDLLRYITHNFRLKDDAGNIIKAENYFLVDYAMPSRISLPMGVVNGGTYTNLTFDVGVDKINNSTGNQEGDLDPSAGMFWNWASGYIFFKHEGKWSNGSKPLLFHFGTNDSYINDLSLPINNLVIDGKAKRLVITLELNKLFTTDWDFNEYNFSMSNVNDGALMELYRTNFAKAFSASFQ